MVSVTAAARRTGGQSSAPLAATSKSRAQAPTLIRKRDEADIDSDESGTLPSPTKKAKVSFNEEVDMKFITSWDKQPQLILEEVKRALERHAHGDDAEFDKLKDIYSRDHESRDKVSREGLSSYTIALRNNVSALDRSCSGLVHLVLQSDWIKRSEEYVTIFKRFLANLVSAQGVWLADTLRMLAEKFLVSPSSIPNITGHPPVSTAEFTKRLHSTLQYVLRIVPLATHTFVGVLQRLFPDSTNSKKCYTRFVAQILAVADFAIELRPEILAMILDATVKIDVQVQVDIEDLADDVSDGLVQGLDQLDNTIQENSDEESDLDSEIDEELDPEVARTEGIKNNVKKLDALLNILFQYYTICYKKAPDKVAQDDTFTLLLSQFNNIILPTYRSRHTQFLLFHFTQVEQDWIDVLIGTLLETVTGKTHPAMIRQSAAAYTASFVSRGNHVEASTVSLVFNVISERLTEYRNTYLPKCQGPDPHRYQVYYSLVQALLYIFCFRWRDLVANRSELPTPSPPALSAAVDDYDDADEPPTFPSIIRTTFMDNVFCALNPLKVCSPSIVEQFASIARHLNIIYVFHLLEKNKRVRLSRLVALNERETALSARKDEDWQQLDAYFPFDPYCLPRSKRWLEGDYREWKGIDGLDDQNGEDSESDDDEGEQDLSESEGTEMTDMDD